MKKLTTKTKNIIITSCVCTVAMSAGIGLAVMFGQNLFKKVSVKADGDWLAYEDDARSLLKRYEKSNGNYSSFKGYELANIAIHKYEETEQHYSIVEGIAAAASVVTVNQTIKTTSIRNGDQFFTESISESSFAKPAFRFYENKTEDFITQYTGDVVANTGGTKAVWDAESKKDIEYSTFENLWGKTLESSNIYTISSKTVLNPDDKVAVDSSGNYVVKLNLDPINANRRYIRQVISNAQPNNDPTFNSLNIEYVMDKDLNLISKTVVENYDITVGMSANTTTNMTEKFYIGEKAIPDLNTNCVYGGK